jgi:hypothetical protein
LPLCPDDAVPRTQSKSTLPPRRAATNWEEEGKNRKEKNLASPQPTCPSHLVVKHPNQSIHSNSCPQPVFNQSPAICDERKKEMKLKETKKETTCSN